MSNITIVVYCSIVIDGAAEVGDGVGVVDDAEVVDGSLVADAAEVVDSAADVVVDGVGVEDLAGI